MSHHRREACRACNGRRLLPFLDLGRQPLANSFLHSPEEFAAEPAFPLVVYFCQDCSLIQLLDVIDAELLFRNYIYVTGTASTIAEHNRNYARTVVDLLEIGARDLVIEAASNDGSLLACFQTLGPRVLGIEPARNIAAGAEQRGIPTVAQFFNSATAAEVRAAHGPARAVIGNNVLAHVDDPIDFLRGARHLLDERGLAIVEVPYLQEFLDRLEFDTVYHEHLSYFSLTALLRLCDAAGLSLIRADFVPVHGGSVRMYAGRPETYGPHAPAVLEQARREIERGFTDFGRWEQFARDVARLRTDLVDRLADLRSQGRSLAAYGAPAKGNTLLNYCRIGADLIPYTVDRNPWKVGLLTPGMHIPVLAVETLLERQPDVVLILPWNFAAEIMDQQREYARRGGRFLLPLPHPHLV